MRVKLLVSLTIAATISATAAAAEPAPKTAAPAGCSYAHYPVKVGDSWEYRMTSRQLDAKGKVVEESSNSYSEEIVAVESDRFRTKTVAEGNESESEWLCGAEGIALKYAEYPETRITASGVTIPSTMEVGSSWTQSFAMEGEGVNQSSKTVNKVTRREEVKTALGTFEAWRVDYEIETIVPDQKPSIIKGTQWFVTDVGIVKSLSVIPMVMEKTRSIETTLEMVKRSSR